MPAELQDPERREVGECDLAENVDELEFQLAGADRDEYLAEHDQLQGADSDVDRLLLEGLSLLGPEGDGEGQSHSHNEHEGRLDHIPEDTTFPANVDKLVGDAAQYRMVLQLAETEAVRDQQKHNEAAIGV